MLDWTAARRISIKSSLVACTPDRPTATQAELP